MAIFGPKVASLQELFVQELEDLYDAEHQIVKALPKVIDAASAPALKAALAMHLEQTHNHVRRLEQVFNRLGAPAREKRCDGMAGILKEVEKTLREGQSSPIMDAAIIGAAQRVEHYEIAAYGTVRAFAERLGRSDVARVLEETLNEEKAADAKLTEVARQINSQATVAGLRR
jgi:ferritin-like metal-binding protein YciE